MGIQRYVPFEFFLKQLYNIFKCGDNEIKLGAIFLY